MHSGEAWLVMVAVGSTGADGAGRGREGRGATDGGLESGGGEGVAVQARAAAHSEEAGAVVVVGSVGAREEGREGRGEGH